MSDIGRKGLGEQVGEKVTPQSQKSYTQVATENVTGAADKVAAAVQPSGDKSATQKVGDSTRGGADKAQGTYLDQAKDVANNIAASAQDALGGAKGSAENASK